MKIQRLATGSILALILAAGPAQACVLEITKAGGKGLDDAAVATVLKVVPHPSMAACNASASDNFIAFITVNAFDNVESLGIQCFVPQGCTPPDPEVRGFNRNHILHVPKQPAD